MSKQKPDKILSRSGDLKSESLGQTAAKPVSILEAARSLQVSPRTVWNYIGKGRLDKVTIGRKVYVSLGSIERFLRSEQQASVAEKSRLQSPNEAVVLSPGKGLVEVSYLEELLARVEQLKAENQKLLECQADQENWKKELEHAKASLVELQTKESEARSRAIILEKEIKYVRTILWILVGVGLSLAIGTASLLMKMI
jgi:molybdenum-dependent DNA-binding transcriptional regulator ModE